MDASKETTMRLDQGDDAGSGYEAPTLTVIGPVREFTFGSLRSGNDSVGVGKKNN